MTRSVQPSFKGPKKRPARRKDKGKPRSIVDVYEYAPSKVRRAKIGLALDRHEIAGRRHHAHGSDDKIDMDIDLAGLGQEAMQKLRARLMRDDNDDNGDEGAGAGVDSDEDEDIESEDAFEESDREDFAGSGFVRKGARAGALNGKRRVEKEVDLNEDEDAPSGDSRSVLENKASDEEAEMDEDGSGEFFDILDVFDGRADADDNEDTPPKGDKKLQTTDVELEEEEEEWGGAQDVDTSTSGEEPEDEDEDEEEDSAVDEDDDELHVSAESDAEDASPEALAHLETFLSTLDPHKRKSGDDDAPEPGPKKRRRVADRTEAGEESEFGVRGSGTLKLDDLLAPLASSESLAALKRATKPLTSSSSKTKTLSAPLPQRAQERLDREAAYEKTKEEVDKWSATMKRIKEAEHLSFPLQAEKPTRVSNLELAARFTPSNALESAVDTLLKSAQLRDQDIPHTEALKMAHLSVEEVAERRAELRLMRELAFRADRKAKRIAKIKSKTYRRIRKKQRERLDGDGDGNGDAEGGVEDEEERLKAEVQRARERATLRHKNTGKWAKAMMGRDELDQDQRQAISEMLERGEKLRRRIHGENSDDDDEEGGDEESGDEEQDEETIKRGAFDELAALRVEDDGEQPALGSKSVFGMKFMRDAAGKRAREADARAEELQKELGVTVDEPEDDEDDKADTTITAAPSNDAPVVQRTGGRLSFRPGVTPGGLKSLGSLASDTSSVTLQSADLIPTADLTPAPSLSTPTPTPTPTAIATSIPNPWLVPTVTSSGPSRKRNEVRVHKDADVLAKSSNKLKKQAEKRVEERERAKDDGVLEIDANDVLTVPEAPPVAPSKSGEKNKKAKTKAKAGAGEGVAEAAGGPVQVEDEDDASDVASEIEAQERTAEEGKGSKDVSAFQQRDLVALAFAGDNVVQAFEEAKRQEIEADAPRENDTTLPGWGTWGGIGTKKKPPKPHLVKTLPGISPTARSDHAKPHVIISEKRDKKAARFLVRDLPYPYTSAAQFERGMGVPLGTEWNTRVGFQRGTLPRVVKKMGAVIDPLEKLF